MWRREASSNPAFAALIEAVKKAGGQAPFARVVGCTQGAIWQMLQQKRPLSPQYVLAAEASTGISRHDLRPDIYPRESAPTNEHVPVPVIDHDALAPQR